MPIMRCYRNLGTLPKTVTLRKKNFLTCNPKFRIVQEQQTKHKNLLLMVCGLEKRYAIVNDLQNDNSGWQRDKKNDKLNLEYKRGLTSGNFFMRVQTEADIHTEGMLCLLNEESLMNKWVTIFICSKNQIPFCKSCKLVKQITKGSKLLANIIDIPFQTLRELNIMGRGFDCQEDKGLFILDCFSIDSDLCPQEIREAQDHTIPETKNVPAYVRALTYEFVPISTTRQKVRTVLNLDNRLDFVPDSILQWVSKMACRDILKFMIKKSCKLEGTPWDVERKIPEKKEFYDWIKKKVGDHEKKMGWV